MREARATFDPQTADRSTESIGWFCTDRLGRALKDFAAYMAHASSEESRMAFRERARTT